MWLNQEEEVVIAKSIVESAEKDNLNVKAFNICRDHIHILLMCNKEHIPTIIHNLKGRSSRVLSIYYNGIIRKGNGINPITLSCNPIAVPVRHSTSTWTQKYNVTTIFSEEQLTNTIKYIINNRIKHELADNKALEPYIQRILNHNSIIK